MYLSTLAGGDPISGLGGGYPIPGLARGGSPSIPGLDGGGGGSPSQIWMGWGYPVPGLDWVDTPPPWTWDGVPPNMGWGTPQTWNGVPPQTWDGYPPDMGWSTPPKTDQHSEHLLCSGQYASCIHAGGLSCFTFFHKIFLSLFTWYEY